MQWIKFRITVEEHSAWTRYKADNPRVSAASFAAKAFRRLLKEMGYLKSTLLDPSLRDAVYQHISWLKIDVSNDDAITDVSDKFLAEFRYDKGELVGQSVFNIFNGDHFEELDRALRSDKMPAIITVNIRDAGGEWLPRTMELTSQFDDPAQILMIVKGADEE